MGNFITQILRGRRRTKFVLDAPSPSKDFDNGYQSGFHSNVDCASCCSFDEIPAPPDGGYGWVIVLASFMCNMLVDGICYSFGVFMIDFVSYFDQPTGKVAWIGSLLAGFYLLCGPLVSALTNRFGCRPVCIAGSVVTSCAFVASTFSPNVDMLLVSFGIFGGIGLGLIYLPSIITVGYYFEKRRALATGMALCGSGVGAFALAPLSQFLVDEYAWKGTVLIYAGIILNCSVFGALMVPIEMKTVKPLLQRMAEDKRIRMDTFSVADSAFFLVNLPDGTVEKRLKIPINMEPGVHSNLCLDQYGYTPDTSIVVLPTIREYGANTDKNPSKENGNVCELQNQGLEKSNLFYDTNSSAREEGLDAKRQDGLKFCVFDDVSENNLIGTDSSAQSFKGNGIPRNSSSPVLNRRFQQSGLTVPKNTSVPYFTDSLTRQHSKRLNRKSNMTISMDLRKYSLTRKLSNFSYVSSLQKGQDDVNSNEEIWRHNSESGASRESRSSRVFLPPLVRKDIFFSGSILNLPECHDLNSYRGSIISFPALEANADLSSYFEGDNLSSFHPVRIFFFKSIFPILSTLLDFRLLKNTAFLIITISNIFSTLGFYVPFVYIMDAAVNRGIPEEKSALLLSVIGITNSLGRIFSGWLSDSTSVNSILLNNMSVLLSGISLLVVPLCKSYLSFVVICMMFGICIAAHISLTSIILVDLLGIECLTTAFGLLMLFRGLATMVGPPIAGAVYDATNSYDASFYIAGSSLVFSSMVSFMIPVLKMDRKSPDAKNNEMFNGININIPPSDCVDSSTKYEAQINRSLN